MQIAAPCSMKSHFLDKRGLCTNKLMAQLIFCFDLDDLSITLRQRFSPLSVFDSATLHLPSF